MPDLPRPLGRGVGASGLPRPPLCQHQGGVASPCPVQGPRHRRRDQGRTRATRLKRCLRCAPHRPVPDGAARLLPEHPHTPHPCGGLEPLGCSSQRGHTPAHVPVGRPDGCWAGLCLDRLAHHATCTAELPITFCPLGRGQDRPQTTEAACPAARAPHVPHTALQVLEALPGTAHSRQTVATPAGLLPAAGRQPLGKPPDQQCRASATVVHRQAAAASTRSSSPDSPPAVGPHHRLQLQAHSGAAPRLSRSAGHRRAYRRRAHLPPATQGS